MEQSNDRVLSTRVGTFCRFGEISDIRGRSYDWVDMAVAKVDDRGRIKLPREMALPGESVIIIDASSYFVGIPIPSDPLLSSGSWLEEARDARELEGAAEERAGEDAGGKGEEAEAVW